MIERREQVFEILCDTIEEDIGTLDHLVFDQGLGEFATD
jgi:hypothetical protein